MDYYKILLESYYRLLSFFFVPNWLVNKNVKTVLEIGCGLGLQTKLIKYRHKKIYAVGLDIFRPYVEHCIKERIYDKCIVGDALKLKFKPKAFDLVLCLQVIEHLDKKDALDLIAKIERIAKRQIIISTPIGWADYHTDDGNRHQEHKSYFYPRELESLGYKTIRMGGKILFDINTGICHKIKNPFFKRIIFVLDMFLTPFYLLFQDRSNYYFFAYKNLD